MENKNAVALKTKDINPANNGLALDIEPLSAGVITIKKKF
jgi:hypothetical protein